MADGDFSMQENQDLRYGWNPWFGSLYLMPGIVRLVVTGEFAKLGHSAGGFSGQKGID